MSDFEREDQELKAMMGDQFQDLSEAKHTPTKCKEETKCKEDTEYFPDPPKGHCPDAQWHPTKQRTFMDDLKDIAKSTLIFGGLNMLVWYWEMAGLMDHSIALPCMWVCVFLAGIGVGKVLGIHKVLRGKC